MKKFIVLTIILSFLSQSFALSMDELLNGYAKNDTELSELIIKLDQEKINLQKTYIQQGINVNITTGNTTINFNNGEPIFTITPKITLDIPQANTSISASTSSENTSFTGASIDISTAIIDSLSNERKLAIEKAERNVELAERNITKRIKELQISFYNELKSLYSAQNSVTSAQDDLVEELEDFELIKAQGYAQSSVNYRTTEISVKTAEWNIEETQRTFTTQLNNFLIDCGFEANTITEVPKLPDQIATITIDSINNYDPSDYISLEETLWNLNYSEKEKESNNDFTLDADFGYNHKLNTQTNNRTNSASVGLSGEWSGFKFSTGVDIPFEEPENTSLSLGFTWDLDTTRNHSLENQSDILDQELNNLTEQKALENLEKQIQNSLTEEKDLAWQRENKIEELALYEELYLDTQDWYERGLVSSSNLLKAKTDYERAVISAQNAYLDIIIYNLELSQLFLGE